MICGESDRLYALEKESSVRSLSAVADEVDEVESDETDTSRYGCGRSTGVVIDQRSMKAKKTDHPADPSERAPPSPLPPED